MSYRGMYETLMEVITEVLPILLIDDNVLEFIRKLVELLEDWVYDQDL